MKTIIIESTVYQVTEKEFVKTQKMQKALHEAKSPLRSRLEMQLSNYFDIAKHNYKLIGDVWFDFRI